MPSAQPHPGELEELMRAVQIARLRLRVDAERREAGSLRHLLRQHGLQGREVDVALRRGGIAFGLRGQRSHETEDTAQHHAAKRPAGRDKSVHGILQERFNTSGLESICV